jgi:phage terminase large subunit-like protein
MSLCVTRAEIVPFLWIMSKRVIDRGTARSPLERNGLSSREGGMAGRGFGKTRAGAEWVSARARECPGARIALVGSSREEVARVMVEGPSGLLAVARTGEAPLWVPTHGEVRFSSGACAFVYSAAAAEAAEALRGVWAMSELMAPEPAEPRIRFL